MRARAIKTLSVLASVGLLAGAFVAGPAEAGKKKKLVCDAFTPGVEDAAEAEVVKITPKATEENPVVIEFEHAGSIPVAADHQYFNVQVYSSTPSAGLWIKDEFSDRHDIDLYLYNSAGEEVALSGGFNTAPEAHDSDGNATTNSEQIPGFPAPQCEGFTIESVGYLTPGTDATLSIWLGEETSDYSTP